MESTIPLLLTHSGKFHCDDVLAYAILRFALGMAGHDHQLVRTRDRAVIAAADIVFHVGGIQDPATSRIDHHQRGVPVRGDDGIAYSAADLVWQVHGAAAVEAQLGPGEAHEAAAIAAIIDDRVIRRVDMLDNGVGAHGGVLELSSLAEDFNGTGTPIGMPPPRMPPSSRRPTWCTTS